MPTYNVIIPISASIFITVKARNKKEAMEKALEEASPPTLCHYCANRVELGEVLHDQVDIDYVNKHE